MSPLQTLPRRTPLAATKARHWAAVLTLACGAAVAQPAATADALSQRHEQAQMAYEQGHYAQAFAESAALADLGHADAARTAAQMSRYGRTLYGMDLPLAPQRLSLWRARVPVMALAVTR
jgi:hypothetical protein